MNNILVKTYSHSEYNLKEILRYASVVNSTDAIDNLINTCINELKNSLSYKVCYREFNISHLNDKLDLSFTCVNSKDLSKNLNQCDSFILFAATIGIEIDRLIAKYASTSPSKALIMQAIGAERIETLCNIFNQDITSEKSTMNIVTKPRFSPGYGDLSLDIQKDIFQVLDCPRKIGLTLNNSLLMSPSKSVTGFIGLYKN